MKGFVQFVSRFVHGNFRADVGNLHTKAEMRRIRLVNYIGLISITSMMSYAVFYMVFDIELFLPAILFLSASSMIALGVIVINNKGFHNLAKILLALLNPMFMSSVSTWIFGPAPGFHTFLFAAIMIPLFLWSVKDLGYLIFFMGLGLSLYIAIEFFPPIFDSLINLPDNYLKTFRSSSILISFIASAAAIIVYIELSNKQETRLVQQAKELEISHQHRDMVYSIVAHDLRGPFKGLMGITDLLLRQFDDRKYLEEIKHIKAIYNSSKVLDNLLDNLLNWAKMQSGNLVIDRKPFNLKNNVDEVISVLNDLLGAKTLTFINKVDPRLHVVADSNMVSTVLRNLLSNAIKFTPKGGEIGITAKLVNRIVELCIHDSGVGIPEDDIKKLFNIQTKLSTSGTNNEKGSGLGLILCKDFIEANGGEIWAKSELGRGSKFYFTLQSISN